MSTELILKETRGRVGLITLNRPRQLNALSPELMQQLGSALYAFDADDAIGAIVITGSEKAFAAGADIAVMKDYDFQHAFRTDYITRDWEHIRNIRKPVVAAVGGYALGGGCELAMMCDIIIAAESARFGQPEINLGTFPGSGGTQRLPRVVPMAEALRMMTTGNPVSGEKAKQLGLVDEVVPGDLLQGALDFAGKLIAEGRGPRRIRDLPARLEGRWAPGDEVRVVYDPLEPDAVEADVFELRAR